MNNLKREYLPYRQGVRGIVVNLKSEILIIQDVLYKDNDWNFVSGGMEPGESPKETILRELREELGSADFEIIGESQHINKYEWPDDLILKDKSKNKKLYRGQEQKVFFIKFIGLEDAMKVNENELKAIKWVKATDLKSHLHLPGQWEFFEKVLEEFGLI